MTIRHLTARIAFAAVLAAGAIPVVGSAPTAAAAEDTSTWSVRPTPVEGEPERANFVLTGRGEDLLRSSVRLRNFGSRELILDVYPADAAITDSGAYDFSTAEEKPVGVGTWIALEMDRVTLAPQQFVDIPFTVRVPAKAESGDHAGGIVTSAAPRAPDPEQSVRIDNRLVNRVHVRVEGALEPRLEITDLKTSYDGTANPLGRGGMAVSYTVRNTGNVRMAAEQSIRVAGPAGITSREAKLERMPELLPNSRLTINTRVDGVWPTVRTSTRVDLAPVAVRPGDRFPERTATVASTGEWTVPWMLLFLLALAAGGPAASVWAVRRARAENERRVAAAVEQRLGVGNSG